MSDYRLAALLYFLALAVMMCAPIIWRSWRYNKRANQHWATKPGEADLFQDPGSWERPFGPVDRQERIVFSKFAAVVLPILIAAWIFGGPLVFLLLIGPGIAMAILLHLT